MVSNLTAQQQEKISQIMERDRSANAETIVDEALDLLLDQKKLEHLRAVIDRADTQVARGEVKEMTPTFWDEIKTRAISRRQRGEKPNPDVWP